MPVVPALLVIAAYFLGTFPTAVLAARRSGRDVTREGSGNPGASNVYRVAGRRAAIATFAGDFLKGALATAMGLLASRHTALVTGAAAVLGHCLPVQRRFKGGKGVATAAGMVVVVEPVIGVVAAVVWAVLVKATKRASVASIAVVLVGPFAVLAIRGTTWETLAIAMLALFIVSRHARNIARLLRGEEATFRGVDKGG